MKRGKLSPSVFSKSFGNKYVEGRYSQLDLKYTQPLNDKWSASVKGTHSRTRVKGKGNVPVDIKDNRTQWSGASVQRNDGNSSLSFDYSPQQKKYGVQYSRKFAEGGEVKADAYSDYSRQYDCKHIHRDS